MPLRRGLGFFKRIASNEEITTQKITKQVLVNVHSAWLSNSTGAGESTLSIFSNFWHTNLLQGPILLWTFVNWKTASFRFGLDDQLDRALIAEVISSNNTFSPVILYETLTHFVKKVCFVNHLFWINHRATI